MRIYRIPLFTLCFFIQYVSAQNYANWNANTSTKPNYIGIGLSNPNSAITLFADGNRYNDRIFRMGSYSNNPAVAAGFTYERGRGTLPSVPFNPSASNALQQGDDVGYFSAAGVDGDGDKQFSASFFFKVDGPVTNSRVPMALTIATGQNTGGLTDRIVVGSNGDVTITGFQGTGGTVKADTNGKLYVDASTTSLGGCFTGVGDTCATPNYVAIGTAGAKPDVQAHIETDLLIGAEIVTTSATDSSVALVARISGSSSSDAIGIKSVSTLPSKRGIGFSAASGYIGYDAMNASPSDNGTYIGFNSYNFTGFSTLTGDNIGVFAYTDGNRDTTMGHVNYSIFGQGAIVGNKGYAGYFTGDVTVTGLLMHPSDRKFKENIADVEGGLDVIMSLRPRTYVYKREAYSHMVFPKDMQYGFIAQEVEAILPEVVHQEIQPSTEDLGRGREDALPSSPAVKYKSVNYQAITPIIVKGMQEQQTLIAQQQTEIQMLKAQLSKQQQELDAIKRLLDGGILVKE